MKEHIFALSKHGAMIRSADALNNLDTNKDWDFQPKNPNEPLLCKETNQDVPKKEEMIYLDEDSKVDYISDSLDCITSIHYEMPILTIKVNEMNLTNREYQDGRPSIATLGLYKSQTGYVKSLDNTVKMAILMYIIWRNKIFAKKIETHYPKSHLFFKAESKILKRGNSIFASL